MSDSVLKSRKALFTEKFNKFCLEKWGRELYYLEKTRKNAVIWAKYSGWTLFLVGLVIAYFLFSPDILYFLEINESYNSLQCFDPQGSIIFKFILFLHICFIFLLISYFPVFFYKSEAKRIILPQLISFIGDFQYIDRNNRVERNKIRNYVCNLKIFDYFSFFSCDDAFKGIYNRVPVSISELNLSRSSGKSTVTVFQGILISFPSFKKFKSNTIIKSNASSCCYLEKVNLEDPEFEKIYDVFSDDQIEARTILTPAFMNRMVECAKKKKERITVSFENNQVNIAVSNYAKTWFEFSVDKPVTNMNTYREIIWELSELLQIIDALKIE